MAARIHAFPCCFRAAHLLKKNMPTVLPELRHLLKLLDDDSPVVREALRAKLIPMRRTLPEQLQALDQPLNEEQERLLNELLTPACREELEESWLSWRWLPTP